jgi:kumamolisin
MLRIFNVARCGALAFAAMMTPVLAHAQTAVQADQKQRLQDMESKLLDAVTPSSPVPADDQVQVTLVLKHKSPTNAETSEGAHIERLTASQFANRLAASPATVSKIEAFAQANHLHIVESDPVKRRVILSGSADAIANAFGTKLHFFSMANGQTYRSNTTPPTLPSELSSDVDAVVGLNSRPVLQPRFVNAHATSSQLPLHVDVSTLASHYNFPSDVNGAGQTIAIMQFGGGFNPADLDAYFASVKLPTPKISVVTIDNAKNSPGQGDSDIEVALDIEVAGTVANAANFLVYFSDATEQGFLNSISDAIHNQQTPSVISISWGGAEDSSWSAQGLAALNSVLEDAATLGITIVAASGDAGSSDGGTDKKLHVDFPASSPYVLAAGGTMFVLNNNTIVGENVWNDDKGATGGGVSLAFPRPAYQNSAKVPPHPTTGFAGRGVPDIAGFADPKTGYLIYVGGGLSLVGGTSAVAPLWAGLIARLNQKLGHPLGFINDKLYAMNGTFRDVTNGSNDVEGLGAYMAAAGWNPCTGLGTPDAAKLLASFMPANTAPVGMTSTLKVMFGDTEDKVRSEYPVVGQPSNGCGSADPCVTLAAPAAGLTFFFNFNTKQLYEIRADAPFSGNIDSLHIGDGLNDVIARLGQPIVQPFDFAGAQAYIFNSGNGPVRCDFSSSQKCQTIFVAQ